MNNNYQQFHKIKSIVISLLLLAFSCFVLAEEATNKDQNNSIEHIDFKKGDSGEGTVIIKLSNSAITPNIVKMRDKIILEFPNTQIAKSLLTHLDLRDFETPMQFIDVAINNTPRITIKLKDDWSYWLYQVNNKLTITVKQLKPMTKDNTLFISPQDIEVRHALQIVADHAKLNLVATDSVNGKMALNLHNVSWEQALDIVMNANGLAKRQEGNILIVALASELTSSTRRNTVCGGFGEVNPLRRELITINYIDAADIVAQFQKTMIQAKNHNSSENNPAYLTMGDNRGSLIVDTRTNTIVANQTEERLEILKHIVAELDRPAQQVTLDTRIVEVNKDYLNTLKEQINNQQELLDIILNKMQKQGKGAVISQPKITVENNKEAIFVSDNQTCCFTPIEECLKRHIFRFSATHNIINNNKIKLTIAIKLTIPKAKTGTKDIVKIKTIIKTTHDKQFIIIDDLEDFEYEQTSGDNKLVIFITPTIIPPTPFLQK